MPSSRRKAFQALLTGKNIVFFDGAMGTMLQAEGITGHACPEELNLSRPDILEKIHRAYIEAGASIIETNTFGANRRKLAKVGLERRLSRIIESAVSAARKAAGSKAFVAGSMGPLGEFLQPVGPVLPGEAYDTFLAAADIMRRAGVDLVVIETMSDLKEVRAACMAVAAAGLPFAVSMTYEPDGRTLLGTPPEAEVITAEALGASLTGFNCGLGPSGLLPVAAKMASVARRPLMAQPNAGLPSVRGGRTVFPTGPEEFARQMESFLSAGFRFLGGCCGTTPDHIRRMVRLLGRRRPAIIEPLAGCRLSSRTRIVLVGASYPVAVVGERINPTGRKQLAAEMKTGSLETVRKEVVDQVRAGAVLLDLNAGAPGLDEAVVLPRLVDLAQKMVDAPPVLDSATTAALEAGLGRVEGRPLINSVNASRRSLETILPLAARYGAAVIGLAMDERGIPADARGRLRMSERILKAATDHGMDASDVLIDCLAVAAGAHQSQVAETLKALRSLGPSLGVGSILGISNISYGLPAREELNAAFLAAAVVSGLDAAIVNPYSARIMDALASAQVLAGRDVGAACFIRRHGQSGARPQASKGPVAADPRADIVEAIMEGDGPRLTRLLRSALAGGADPMRLSQEYLIPGLERVGELFEKKVFFLPQVMAAAEAVREAFGVIKTGLGKKGSGGTRILLATVEGDIHDLGKNILKTLLENYGYEVEDMGINVPAPFILARLKKKDIGLVGLSALMTTTLPAMEAAIRAIKKKHPRLPVMVGGAVLTEEYARSIGADGYAPDASRAVKTARKLLGG